MGPGSAPVYPGSPRSLLSDSDAKAYGYDRSSLLRSLIAVSDSCVVSGGYILDRPGRICRYLGPCVALDRSTARSLIAGAIARHPDGGWFWDLLPANREAVAIAQELGFVPARKLTRMVRGRELRGKDENVFAIGGFEFG